MSVCLFGSPPKSLSEQAPKKRLCKETIGCEALKNQR